MAQFAIDEILTTGIQISGFVFDRSYSLGTAGQVLTSTSSGVMWQADSSIIDLSALSGQIAATGTLLNNRINSLSGYVNGTFVSGSGVANYVARWSNTKELLTGSIYDLGTGIGIGTTSPAAKLEVKGADNAVITAIFQSFAGNPAYNGGIQLGNAVANQNSQIYHSSAGDNTLTFVSNYAGGTANKFIFAPGGTETVRFQQNGRVGIGFQTPTETLDVSGRVRAIGEVFTLNAATLTDSQTSIALSRLGAITDQKYWEILSYNAAANGDFVIRTINDAYSNAAEGMRIVRGSSYNIASVLFPNGKVGIGTASPTTLLSVGPLGSTTAASGLTFGGDAQANLYRFAEDTIKTDGSLVVTANATFAGSVGIGLTNPAVKLDVSGGNARFSDYIIIGEDLAYPSNTGSAYLGYSTSVSSGPQSNLELIDALSNAIGVNDPLRFRGTISGQYFSGNNWYADPAPLSYGTLLNGNANSYLDIVTSSEYSVGISGKRFVVDQGTSYTRPNFILLNTDWNQNFWGFKLNVENSNDLINWTNCITEQAFSTNNTKGIIALSIANSIQAGGISRYFRFSFVANQVITAGSLRVNKIRSLGNQNYSSSIPVSTSVAGNLIASVGIISPTITSLSGNLAATGSVLDTKINTLSGYSNSTFATITNLATTGSVLDTKINTLSGYSNSTFATITNLATTGSVLNAKINSLSGYITTEAVENNRIYRECGLANLPASTSGWYKIAQFEQLNSGFIYDLMHGEISYIYGDNQQSGNALVNFNAFFRQNSNLASGQPFATYSYELRTSETFKSFEPFRIAKTVDLGIGPKTYELQVSPIGNTFGLISWDIKYTSTSANSRPTVYATEQVAGNIIDDPRVSRFGNKIFTDEVGIGIFDPLSLLSVGGSGSTSAISGITFGADASANLYRSAAGTLKTDGRLNIVGDADNSTPDLFFNGAGGFGSAGGQVRAWSPDNTTLSWYWDNTQFTYNNFPVRVVNASSVVRVYLAPSSDSYINNASNFGIGTNAPGTRLDVRFPTNPATDNGAGNNVLRVWTTAGYAADVGGAIGLGGEYSGGLLQSFGQIAGRKTNNISGNNAGYLQFATTNNGGTMSEWMRIDAGGKVGIGTNAPNYNLDVIGSVRASGELISEGNNARISLFRNNGINYFDWSSGQSLYFSTQTSVGGAGRSTLLAVTSGGNVGIGTLTPNGKLHVVSPDSTYAFSVAGATKGVRFNINSAGTYIQGVDNTLAGSYQSLVLGGSDLYFQTNGLTNAVYIDSSGDVGINTTSPTSKLNVVETTPTGTRIQLGTASASALMNSDSTNDLLILNAPYGSNPAGASNIGAKWGIKFIGSTDALSNSLGKTSAIYAVSEDTLGYNRGTSLAFYTNQLNDQPYAERMRIYHNGNIGIGITNPSNKLHISGGGISFTTSTGLAVPMIGIVLPTNIAYIGPYTTTTDGNAPTTVVFNQGASVQQSWFYSSGRIAMVLNKEGRLNIAGNLSNTPPALLNVGPASSVDAVSGMSFGNDSSANLYRSAASTIKTDGNINIVGTATLGPTVVNGGTLPSSPTGSTVVGFNYNVNNGNISQVNFVEKRFATGGDWTTATTRIQKRVDVTDQAYIEFNPSGALYGMALGVAAGGSFEAMRILSNGRIGIGTTNPTAKLSLNKGSKDQFLALDIANNDQKYALYVDQDNNGSNSFSVWDATNSHTAIRYLPSSAGYWQLYTNNIERVRIDNNGNVGIGQTNPLSKFVVNAGTVNTTTYTTSEARIADGSLHLMKTVAGGIFESIRAMNMDTTAGTTVRVLAASTSDPFNNGNGGKVFIDAIRTATNMDLAFSLNDVAGAAAVERVRFMGNGNVGIGITNPACKLDVAGTIRSSTNEIYGFGASDNVSLRAASASNVLGIYTSNVERLRLAANGYFGVGTDNPSTLLSIGRAGSTSAASGITFGAEAASNIYRSSTNQLKTDGSFVVTNTLIVGGGENGVRILKDGSDSISSTLYLANAGNTRAYNFQQNAAGTNLALWGFNSSNAWQNLVNFNYNGNVGIGTTAASGRLHIVSTTVGDTVLRADGTNGTLFSVVDDLSDSLMSVNNSAGLPVFEVFADDRVVAGQYGSGDFVIRNNKVGIGATNPLNKLSVIGAASIGSTSYNITAPTNGLIVQGNVGIGTTNPTTNLSVIGEIYASSRVISDRYASVVNGNNNSILFSSNTTSFINNGSAAIFIKSDGKVGIGTTNPAWSLDVSGTAVRSFASGTVEPGFIVDYASSNGYGGFFLHTNGVRKWRIGNVGDTDANNPALFIWQEGVGARMYFRTNGNVGVGTTTPDNKLSLGVASDSALGSTSDGLKITDGTRNVQLLRNGTGYNYAGVVGSGSMLYSYDRMYIVADTSNPILFHAGGAERVRVQSNGNVGINTNAPTNTLQVVGQIAIKGDESADNAKIYIQASDNSNRYTVETDLDANTVNDLLIFRSNTVDNMLVLKGNGNVGIGTTNPTHKLEVFNTANSQTYVRVNNQDTGGSAYAGLDLQSYGGGWQVRVPASTTFVNPLLFSFNEAERARITSDGKVGIGTSVPTGVLTVHSNGTQLRLQTASGPGAYFTNISSIYDSAHPFTIAVANNSASATEFFGIYADGGGANNRSVFPNGAVGIGTTNPTGKLSVDSVGANAFNVCDSFSSNVRVSVGTINNAGTTYGLIQTYQHNTNSAGVSPLNIQPFGGNVGIGLTVPTDKIQISGGGISFTSSTGLAVPMLGLTALNVAYVGPYNTPTDGNAPSTVLFNHGASVQQTWFYSSGSVAMVLNRQGRLHIGNLNNTPNCLLSVGPSSSTTAVSGMCFGNDAQANLYRSAEDTIKTDGNLVVAGTTSLNGHIYGQKTVALSTASWTTVLTVNMLAHNSCYVKIGAFGDWSNHSAIAFVSELFIQNGDNAYNTPGTIITAHDNTGGAAGDKIDIQIVDPAAAGTQNFLIQLKLISATSSTNSSLITYHVMGQQASVT